MQAPIMARPSSIAAVPRKKVRAGALLAADSGGPTQRIVDSITTTIVERRLMPGTTCIE